MAYACLTLPFAEAECSPGMPEGCLWEDTEENEAKVRKCLFQLFKPHQIIHRVSTAAIRNMLLQPALKAEKDMTPWITHSVFGNAREFALIQNELAWEKTNFEIKAPVTKKKNHSMHKTKGHGKNTGKNANVQPDVV